MRYLVVLLLLTGCATASPEAVTVKWVRVAQADIHKVCAGEHGKAAAIVIGHYRACSRWSRDAKICTIGTVAAAAIVARML